MQPPQVRLQETLEDRRAELALVQRQEAELAASEAALAQRLWEVQETRRRHDMVQQQLEAAVAEVESALSSKVVGKGEGSPAKGEGRGEGTTSHRSGQGAGREAEELAARTASV